MADASALKNLNDPIARYMRGDFASLPEDQTVGEVLKRCV